MRFNGYYVSLPLLGLLEDLERALAVDQPVIGLSEPVRVPRARFRDAVFEVVDALEPATCSPGPHGRGPSDLAEHWVNPAGDKRQPVRTGHTDANSPRGMIPTYFKRQALLDARAANPDTRQ